METLGNVCGRPQVNNLLEYVYKFIDLIGETNSHWNMNKRKIKSADMLAQNE